MTAVLPWKVRVTVCGAPAGSYDHDTFEQAKQMADDREAKFGVLGCHYQLIPPANECQCCGKPGVYVRTRYFDDENADVWECATEGCRNFNLIWHAPSPKESPPSERMENAS
jgi:hypothetical protein